MSVLAAIAEPTVILSPKWKDRAKFASGASLFALLICVTSLGLNAYSSGWVLILEAQLSAAAALAFGLAALVFGVTHLARSRPDLRRPLIFLFLISLVVLGAHLYVINSPAAYTDGTPLTGSVGSRMSDSFLTVTSAESGSTLTLTATNAGSNSISSLVVSLGNTTLPQSGFADPPAPLDPLQPPNAASVGYRDSVQGTWVLPAGSSGTLTVRYQYLTCYKVPDPGDSRGVMGCVMDESYYVPWATGGQTGGSFYPGFLQGAQCSTSTAFCNLEHPFLAKAIIAAGIAVFGVDTFGWRIFNVVLGTLSVALLFILVYLVSGNRKLAYFASVLFALDTMFFVHSSAAVIDVPTVFFSILGFIFYFWKASWWKLDHLTASGVFFGLAALSKETAIFLLMVVVSYEIVAGEGKLFDSFRRSTVIVLPAALVFILGIQVYDTLFASGSMPYFFQHVSYILSYGSGLKGGGWTDSVLGTYITPLNWLTFYSPVSYLVTRVSVTAGASSYSYVGVGYYGVTNVVIVWMAFVWVPFAVYRVYKSRREPSPSGDDRLALFLVLWFLWNYVPYVLLWVYGRVTYPFYILPAVPALAAGAAFFITRQWFSFKLALVYVAFALVLFFIYFPVKDFLPVFLRVLIGK